MANEPEGRELLLRLGARRPNIVAKGERYIYAKHLDKVAEFVGVESGRHVPLPPQELFEKWITILSAARRYIRQVPNDQMNLNATHNRGRPIRALGYHIFNIGDVYLQCVLNGATNMDDLVDAALEDPVVSTGEEIASYADAVISRLERWWHGLADKSLQNTINITHYGIIPTHQLLEKCTWHSAQHARQLADVLDRQGIEPDGRFTVDDLAGLPLPKRIWN